MEYNKKFNKLKVSSDAQGFVKTPIMNSSQAISSRVSEQVRLINFIKVSQEELSQLIENSSSEQVFKGYDFSGLDFTGIEFDKKMRFLDCKFMNASFKDCDLSLVNFVNCDFANAILTYITFGVMIACNFIGCFLEEFYLSEETVLIKCDFTRATLGLSFSDYEIRMLACIFKNIQSIVEGKPPFGRIF